MGQAKQRGTYEDRVQQAKNLKAAARAATREAAFNEAQARQLAALDAEEDRIELGNGRVAVVSGGRDRLKNRALVTAALIAALGPVR